MIAKKELLAVALARSGACVAADVLARWSGLLVLAYHRIGDHNCSAFDRGLWSASAEDFDAHIGCIKSHCDVIGADDLPEVAKKRRGRFCLVTFDDGYVDNYSTAFPILCAHNVPGVFFVSSGFVDRPKLPWWDEIAWMVRTSKESRIRLPRWKLAEVLFDDLDREGAVRQVLRLFKELASKETEEFLRDLGTATGTGRCDHAATSGDMWMTWDMLREMQKAGMEIGGHTVNHPVLSNLSDDDQCAEVDECARRLQAELDSPMRLFSYPVGARACFNDATLRCLRAKNVEYAFSYYGGVNNLGEWVNLDLKRIGVNADMSLDLFRCIVSFPMVFGC